MTTNIIVITIIFFSFFVLSLTRYSSPCAPRLQFQTIPRRPSLEHDSNIIGWRFKSEVQVRSQGSHVEFMVDKVVKGLCLPVIRDFPVSIFTVMLRAHVLYIYHRSCMILATNSVVKQSIYLNFSNTDDISNQQDAAKCVLLIR